ncbi:polyamine aminopropyltransferase [Flaviaesturariibacter amylovorans]|uniref:Polyamine aminopropyltransferase n=1 Tax=Flaviaesturariibacter amylovorans TaxID=1084520 RepID=A0ABP8GYM5_9BACT
MTGNRIGAQWLLLLAVFVIATCGLIYELVAGTLASYLLGDSVTQFSLIIGIYLFAMGVGSWLSRFLGGNLLEWFIRIELLVGLVGGFSSTILFLVFPVVFSFRTVLYSLVFTTGMLVGLELPLLMRILKDKVEFRDLVSRVFTVDYIGALLASLLFPLLLVPHLGLIRTALFFGILNTAVGWYLTGQFRSELRRPALLRWGAVLLIAAELVVFVFSETVMHYSETMTFNDQVVYARSTPYQRIVLTRNRRELRLFLNGNLQFSSADEYRYHEALVHPALSKAGRPRNVLVLGGGDGLAVREVLKHPSVERVHLVDLDPAMTQLFRGQEVLARLNGGALAQPRVRISNADAFVWLRANRERFDAIIIDFPDPSNYAIGKLYTDLFYTLVKRSLAPGGVAVVQSTSPYVAPRSFWCVDSTIRSVGLRTVPYHNFVPSFGEWGYIMAFAPGAPAAESPLPKGLRFLNEQTMEQMLVFPKDMRTTASIGVNKLNNQLLVHYFEEEWSKYSE